MTDQAAPQMTRAIGIGADTSAELLIVARNNAGRAWTSDASQPPILRWVAAYEHVTT